MKKRSLAVLMAGVMAASMMTGVVSVYADADSKDVYKRQIRNIRCMKHTFFIWKKRMSRQEKF